MDLLLKEIRHNPLLWLLVFVPVIFIAEQVMGRFTDSALRAVHPCHRAARGPVEPCYRVRWPRRPGCYRRNAERHAGELTETDHRSFRIAGREYMLTKATMTGAIVTKSLFVLGASFLLGGLKHHVQDFNRCRSTATGRSAVPGTVALLIPSAVGAADAVRAGAFTQKLSLMLAIVLISIYGLGLLFTLKTHKEFFASAEQHGEKGAVPWPVAWRSGHWSVSRC